MLLRPRLLQAAAGVIAVALMGTAAATLLLTPAQGDVLVLFSSQSPDRVGAGSLELHSTSGTWVSTGQVGAQRVPKAPDTATAVSGSVPIGDYDSLRFDGVALPARIQVRRQILTAVLIAIARGHPVNEGAYVGSEGISVGLNELSGQLKPMPEFSLLDQFGRAFTNRTIAGHPVILAAFNTTCHQTCPLVTGLFLQLQRQLPASVLLVEATTSPAEDSPGVLRQYAGRIGAAWLFVTADRTGMVEFWKPFAISLSSGDVHQSLLAVIDGHGYIRTFWLGAPDVGDGLPLALREQLSQTGLQMLATHGNGWGQSQVLDSLQNIGELVPPSSGGAGPAPDISLLNLDSHRVSLKEFRGRSVLINFWATYCVPCRTEMPLIERMAAQHQGLVVLLVDERDDPGAARTFASDLHISSTILSDPDGRVGDLYGIPGLPSTFFVHPDGTIEGRYVGQTDERSLTSHISAIGA